ncbi:DVU_1556 family methyltransferase [Desulfovibrio aminophilus]|uniref:DVU_1556 family methyltransferase n=1 Tax=Desulfovibrio aminophilus TaxID=81425 RepID=UPI00339A7916
MSEVVRPLYHCPSFQQVSGPALRPGGSELTARGLDLCGFSPGDRVADLGCGPGATLGLLYDRGLRALGLDISEDFLLRARTGHPEAPLLRARIEALPLAGGVLDGLCCECVLSTQDDPDPALAEMARTLHPGGRLLLSDLYVRRTGAGAGITGCAAGARPLDELENRLQRHGLRPLHVQDHSRALSELAGRLIFQHGSLDALRGLTGDEGCGCRDLRGLGYCLIIAEKETS